MGQTLSAPKLLDAIQHDSLDEVVQIIDRKKATARSKLQSGNMACHMAAESGSVELLMAIVRGYATDANRCPEAEGWITKLVCLRNSVQRTPLMLASLKGHSSMVKQLLQLGANLWDADGSFGETGRTALHMACRAGKLETVMVLLQWEQDHPNQGLPLDAQVKMVNVKTDAGFTPAHYASHGKNVEILKLLLAQGAAVSPRCTSHCSCDLSYPSGTTPLHVAATTGSLECVQLLLTAHVERSSRWPAEDPSSVGPEEMDPRLFLNEEGRTPYAVAVANRRWACMHLLTPPSSFQEEMLFDRTTGEWGPGVEWLRQEEAKATHKRLLAEINSLSEQLCSCEAALLEEWESSTGPPSTLGGMCSDTARLSLSRRDLSVVAVDRTGEVEGDSCCPVCLDTLTSSNHLGLATCSHLLCVTCASEIIRLHRTKLALCPLCRVAIGGFSLPHQQGKASSQTSRAPAAK